MVLLFTLRDPTAGGYTYLAPRRLPLQRRHDLLVAAMALAGPALSVAVLAVTVYLSVTFSIFSGAPTPTKLFTLGLLVAFGGDGAWRLYGSLTHSTGDRAIVQAHWHRFSADDE